MLWWPRWVVDQQWWWIELVVEDTGNTRLRLRGDTRCTISSTAPSHVSVQRDVVDGAEWTATANADVGRTFPPAIAAAAIMTGWASQACQCPSQSGKARAPSGNLAS